MMRKIVMFIVVVVCLGVVGLVGCNNNINSFELTKKDIVKYMDDNYKNALSDEEQSIISETVYTTIQIINRINTEDKFTETDVAVSKYIREMMKKCFEISGGVESVASDGKVIASSEYVINSVLLATSPYMAIEPLSNNDEEIQVEIDNMLLLIDDKYDSIIKPYLELNMDRYEEYRIYIINNTVK